MANLPSFTLSDTTPLFLWWHHLTYGYRTNFPTACQLSPLTARKILDRGCWGSRSPQSRLGLHEASHPSTSWLQNFSCAGPAPGPLWNLEHRSGKQTLSIAQPGRCRKIMWVKELCASDTQRFHRVRHCAVGVEGQEMWAPGAHPIILCVYWATARQIYTRRGWQVWKHTHSSALGGFTPWVL